MYTIIYNKTTGNVLNVIGGKSDENELRKFLSLENEILYKETLPTLTSHLRQELKVKHGDLIVINKELIPEQEQFISRIEKEQEINKYKKLLADSDYKAIKYAEGLISEEEYAPIKAQRQEYRNKINELQR